MNARGLMGLWHLSLELVSLACGQAIEAFRRLSDGYCTAERSVQSLLYQMGQTRGFGCSDH